MVRHVLALNVAALGEAALERGHEVDVMHGTGGTGDLVAERLA